MKQQQQRQQLQQTTAAAHNNKQSTQQQRQQQQPDATDGGSFQAGLQKPVSGDADLMSGVEGESGAGAFQDVERVGGAPKLNASEDDVAATTNQTEKRVG